MLREMTVKQLRRLMAEFSIDSAGCLEKSEMVSRVNVLISHNRKPPFTFPSIGIQSRLLMDFFGFTADAAKKLVKKLATTFYTAGIDDEDDYNLCKICFENPLDCVILGKSIQLPLQNPISSY